MNAYSEIKDEVISLIKQSLNLHEVEVTEQSKIADLSEDSIQLFELLLTFERTYQTETAYEDIVRLHTVADIITYIERVKYSAV